MAPDFTPDPGAANFQAVADNWAEC